MRLKFDPDQQHQLAAIAAVVDLFDGQPKLAPESKPVKGAAPLAETVFAVSNRLTLSPDAILENLRRVQKSHNGAQGDAESQKSESTAARFSKIAVDEKLSRIEKKVDCGLLRGKTVEYYNFSIEMETGTGKTYIYLRTIRELIARFGFRKFIVVTPSIAIREGVLHALDSLAAHLRARYPEPCEWRKYDSAKLTAVRDFAVSRDARVLAINIQSFNKDLNVVNREADSFGGDAPLNFIQAARPIVILDEPQKMESGLSIESLARLNPLFTLRYSATHKNPYNLLHRLSPADAYRQGLVKKIAVNAVALENQSLPAMRLFSVDRRYKAKIELQRRNADGQISNAKFNLERGQRLGDFAKLPQYDRFIIDDIRAHPPSVSFRSERGIIPDLTIDSDPAGSRETTMRAQIRATIEEHLRARKRNQPQGVKTLSLFFIDRVANFRDDDGIIRRLFAEEFDRARPRVAEWKNLTAVAVAAAYFASSKGGNTEKDAAQFDLIMRDKESLLTFARPGDDQETRAKRQVEFIFTHSALREGWDNPNIFQICALNESVSETRKRQEIGRGVRLAVDQNGARTANPDINTLTVIVNQSYADYVAAYQWEIAEDYRAAIEALLDKPLAQMTAADRARLAKIYGGDILPPAPAESSARANPRPNPRHIKKGKNGRAEFSPAFRELWETIKQKTNYFVTVDSEQLVADAAEKLRAKIVAAPKITISRAGVEVGAGGVFSAYSAGFDFFDAADSADDSFDRAGLIEAVSQILKADKPPLMLTRKTIDRVLERGDENARRKNPIGFANAAAAALRETLAELMVAGISYEKIQNDYFEWEQHFAVEERAILKAMMEHIESGDNCAYDWVECDSQVEREFARDLSKRDDIDLFLKLPRNFEVPTPVGDYRPDWAILFSASAQKPRRLCFIAETKSAVGDDGNIEFPKLRRHEELKIRCAARHFGSRQLREKGVFGDKVDYRVVKKADQVKIDP